MIQIEFLDKNPALFGALLGAGGTLFGVFVTQLTNIFVKRFEINAQVRHRKLDWSWEFEKKNIIEPILTFLDSELKLMTFVYIQGFEGKKEDSEIKKHILDMSTVSARIKALDDQELNEKFSEFTRKRIGVGNNVFDEYRKDMSSAFSELQEAEKLAGEIIWSIKIRIRQQDELVMRSKRGD
ncbi:hypothetical protein [Synechococcus sp. PCC 6312]|uniref:hypothetical protein n=1 Tax=Synechococcus sp. (strain ATCC 27167 / PCC 6312) TaxID=195253 RepID=UPI00059D56CC|nr:hypothetical protein [Synechococcus sp. PCC 6312]